MSADIVTVHSFSFLNSISWPGDSAWPTAADGEDCLSTLLSRFNAFTNATAVPLKLSIVNLFMVVY